MLKTLQNSFNFDRLFLCPLIFDFVVELFLKDPGSNKYFKFEIDKENFQWIKTSGICYHCVNFRNNCCFFICYECFMRFLKVFDRKVSGKHDLIERISKYLIVIYLKKMKKNYLKNI